MTAAKALEIAPAQVARLTRGQRESRVAELIAESQGILSAAIEEHVRSDRREVSAVVLLFSGGNDSTTLAHMFRQVATHAAHANTTIGIEATRDFVRRTCKAWELPLLERRPPRSVDHYSSLVLDQGFPGPGHHYKMYQRLKERALEQVRRELVTNPRRERVVFLAGRRRSESQRRAQVPASERKGSIVWVSPLVHWTKLDLTTYRLLCGDVPVNEVTALVHMSGECCCGSFARPGEREELAYWFPELFQQIGELEDAIVDRQDIPILRRRWGWGADGHEDTPNRPMLSGPLCTSCDSRLADAVGTADPTLF